MAAFWKDESGEGGIATAGSAIRPIVPARWQEAVPAHMVTVKALAVTTKRSGHFCPQESMTNNCPSNMAFVWGQPDTLVTSSL